MHKFLATLEEAAYECEDNPAQAALLRELVNSLSSGRLLLVPTDDVWHLAEEAREDFAIAKLGQLIKLVVSIRTAWIASPESEHAREVAGRCLGPLEGDMSVCESWAAARYLLTSMGREKRAEYDFCFQANGSKQFLFALLRQPSVLKGESLENLLKEWSSIKKSSAYNEAVEQLKECTKEETQQKAVLQNLRMQINRFRRKGEDTEEFLRGFDSHAFDIPIGGQASSSCVEQQGEPAPPVTRWRRSGRMGEGRAEALARDTKRPASRPLEELSDSEDQEPVGAMAAATPSTCLAEPTSTEEREAFTPVVGADGEMQRMQRDFTSEACPAPPPLGQDGEIHRMREEYYYHMDPPTQYAERMAMGLEDPTSPLARMRGHLPGSPTVLTHSPSPITRSRSRSIRCRRSPQSQGELVGSIGAEYRVAITPTPSSDSPSPRVLRRARELDTTQTKAAPPSKARPPVAREPVQQTPVAPSPRRARRPWIWVGPPSSTMQRRPSRSPSIPPWRLPRQ